MTRRVDLDAEPDVCAFGRRRGRGRGRGSAVGCQVIAVVDLGVSEDVGGEFVCFAESGGVVGQECEAGGADGFVVETVPLPVWAADVGDEVAAIHGAGVVDAAAESVSGLDAGLLVGLFEVGGHVEDLGHGHFVAAFSVGCPSFGALEAGDSDE